jgi:crossover junction endodeoxyribonuclease RuvC
LPVRTIPDDSGKVAGNKVAGKQQEVPRVFSTYPIIGLDASVAKVGFAVLFGSTIRTSVFRPASTGIERLHEIRAFVQGLLESTSGLSQNPPAVVVEGYSFASKNSRAHATGEVGGIIRLAVKDARLSMIEVPPTSLKKFITGVGNSPKTGMPLGLFKRFGVDLPDEDQADAASLALFGASLWGFVSGDITKVMQEALRGHADLL